jgi:hypothetical protein
VTEIKKFVTCKCGEINSFVFSSDMNLEEINLFARCKRCDLSLHITLSSLLAPKKEEKPPEELNKQELNNALSEQETKESVENAVRELFG